MFKAKFNETEFCIINIPTLTESSREVQYSDLTIDFRGQDESMLPIQYQEVQVLKDSEVVLTGYVDSIEFDEINSLHQPLILHISLITPYGYTTKRTILKTIDAVPLNLAIEMVLEPLLLDGYTIEVNELNGNLVSEIFQQETVEKCMNYLGNKFNFVWNIDKNKKIYLYNTSSIEARPSMFTINAENSCYVEKIKPSKNVVDYANQIVVKNAFLIGGQDLVPATTVLRQGQTYTFKYPISIAENSCFRISDFAGGPTPINYAFWLETNIGLYQIVINLDIKTFTFASQIGFAGQDDNVAGKKILLIRDNSEPTKIIGFVWNVASETVSLCFSNSSINPIIFNFVDPAEINKIKGKLNTSGVIEKIVNANGKYFIYDELLNFIRNIFRQNNNETSSVDATFKGRINDNAFINILEKLEIFNAFSVNLPFIKGSFTITDLIKQFDRETITVDVKARTSNFNENFADIYRESMPQVDEELLKNVSVLIYNRDDRTFINKQVLVNGDVVNE